MTTSSQNNQQTQQQSTQTNPWAQTLPQLGTLLGSLGNQNTGVTNNQTGSLSQLQANASGIPNFGPAVGGIASGLLGNIPNLNQNAQQNLSQLQSTLSPYFASGYTDPTQNPATAGALNAITQQVGNAVNGQFAASGRNGSPANTTALAYGITNAEAPYLLNESNTLSGLQQGAASTLFNAGNTTNSSLLGNIGGGIAAAGANPTLATQGPMAALQAANAGYSQPYSNIGALESLLLPISQLGGQYTGQGQSTSNTQYTPSLLSSANTLFGGANPLAGNLLNFGGNFLSGIPSLLGV